MTKTSQKVSRSDSRMRGNSSSRNKLLWITGLGAAIIATTALAFIVFAPPVVPTLDGVIVYNNLSRDHSEAPQSYAQTPPAGGVHSAEWQNCGFYDQPVRNEKVVHSLEHGAVWIAYQPDLPAATIDRLRSLTRGRTHVLVAPYPNLPKPVVATAWELQLPLDDVADPRLSLFVSRYEKGPQTPEPGALCTGGIGTPLS